MYLKNKDKEFIVFKHNLINIYYSSLIILFIFLLSIDKNNYFFYLLDFYLYFIYFLFFILFIYSLLLSNIFILFLFNVYKFILNCINILNKINLEPIVKWGFYSNNNNLKFKFNLKGVRNYSNYTKHDENTFEDKSINEALDNGVSYEKALELKDFHNKYDVFGGYFGYSEISHLGNIHELENLTYNKNLITKNLS